MIRRWMMVPAMILAGCIAVAAGCAKKAPTGPGSLSFETEGKNYEVREIVFTYLPLGSEGRKFVDIGFDPARVKGGLAAPGASIQWKTQFNEVKELKGRSFDLGRDEFNAHVQFVLDDTDTGLVHPGGPPQLRLEITDVADGFVVGAFSGEGFVRVSAEGKPKDGVPVSGSFRARVISVTR